MFKQGHELEDSIDTRIFYFTENIPKATKAKIFTS